MTSKGLVMLAAGGTGGHLFPAQALAESLVKRGFDIHLMTDHRVRDYGKNFPASQVHVVPSASPSLSLTLPKNAATLASGFFKAWGIFKKNKPLAVAGFGGYPSFPPLFAASWLKIPCLVHEQNAVLGRANKVLAGLVDVVATSFPTVIGVSEAAQKKLTFTGNPVRAIALAKAAAPYPEPKPYGPFSLVVFGGSQGAKFFSDFMPDVFKMMAESDRKRLRLVQQCRAEDLDRVAALYKGLHIQAELNAFFADMPAHIASAHLVVCRSGASSIAELGVIGRPAALVPLPYALDNDQLKNAQSFANAGGGWVLPQRELMPAEFAAFLSRLMSESETLKRAADCALKHGRPDAAERLADVVEDIIARRR